LQTTKSLNKLLYIPSHKIYNSPKIEGSVERKMSRQLLFPLTWAETW